MSKTKTIILSPGYYKEGEPREGKLGYRVERVTDSLEFTPGDIISHAKADELCHARDWKVTIERNKGSS